MKIIRYLYFLLLFGSCNFQKDRPFFTVYNETVSFKCMPPYYIDGTGDKFDCNFSFRVSKNPIKINGSDYYLIFLGLFSNDTLGYLTFRNDKLFYLNPYFKSYSSDDPRSKIQEFLDYNEFSTRVVKIFGTSLLDGTQNIQTTTHIVLDDTIVDCVILPNSTIAPPDLPELHSFKISKKRGFLNFKFILVVPVNCNGQTYDTIFVNQQQLGIQ